MKTITISVDDETHRLYQSRADAIGATVEEWAGARLADLLPRPASGDEAELQRKSLDDLLARIDARRQGEDVKPSPGVKLTRDELHDRNALR